jgi:hypothetical protein
MPLAVSECGNTNDWLERLFAGCGGWVTLFSLDRRDGTRHTDWAQVDDVAALAATADQRASHSCVWFGVATRKEQLDSGRRGGAEDCLDIPGLWVDIDVEGPNHRGAHPLPTTVEAAAAFLNDFPLAPTAVVRSGGGLQGWWLFPEPIAADKETVDLLAAWGTTWVELGRRRSWHVDNVFDVARIMRLPGTWNRKNQPVPVTAKAVWDRRYQPSDFEAHLLEAPPAPEPGRIPYIGPERPGDAFNAVRRGGDVLAAAGFTLGRRDPQGEEHWTRPGKDPKDGSSATVYLDGHTTLWSDTICAMWSAVELRRPYDPFGLYAVLFHSGDFTAASDELAAQGYGTSARAKDDLSWIPQAVRDAFPEAGSAGVAVEEETEAPKPPPWPEMPIEALHGIFGDIVATLEPHTEADPAGLLACFIAYFGAAVGAGPHFRLSGTTQTARVNMLVVGDSARARKGSAEAMARWVMRTADPAIATERRASGLNSGEGLIDAVRDPRWGKDKKGQDILLDEGVADKRLLLYEPEFAGRLLTAIKRSGSTISALLRMAWDDGNLQTMNSRNPLRATGAHLCVIGNVTIDELLEGASTSDLTSGLLNRFLFVAVHATRRLPFGGILDDLVVEDLGRQLADRLHRARQRSRIDFGDSCQDTWPAAYDALMDDAPAGPLGHLAARGPVQVQRLALIYALAAGSTAIEVDHLASAVAFWSYCRDSAQLIFTGDVAGRVTGDIDGDQLLKLLIDSDRPWSVMEIRDHFGWSGTKAAGVRARLEKLGLIKIVQIPREGGGRPRTMVVAR